MIHEVCMVSGTLIVECEEAKYIHMYMMKA